MVVSTRTGPEHVTPAGVTAEPAVAAAGPAEGAAAGGVATALPVHLAIRGPELEAVTAWVEGVLGWQVSDPHAHDPVPPVLALVDPADDPATIGPAAGADLPTVLLVPDAAPAAAAAEAARRQRPAGILGWPSQREELPELAARLLAQPRGQRAGGPSVLRVGGSAGGVGTTTVCLALAGLKAWEGSRTLAAVRGYGLPWCPVPTAALGGGDLWSAADALPGFDGRLRAVRLVDGEVAPELADPAIGAVVLDLGPAADCDVLVCRPDAAGLAALQRTTAAAVVVVGDGPLPRSAVTTALQGRRHIQLPLSARVARAGASGRSPAGLPGTFVARLAPLLAGGPSPRGT